MVTLPQQTPVNGSREDNKIVMGVFEGVCTVNREVHSSVLLPGHGLLSHPGVSHTWGDSSSSGKDLIGSLITCLEPSRIFFIPPKRRCYCSSRWPRAPGAYWSPQTLLRRFGLFPISPFFLGQSKPSALSVSLLIQVLSQHFSSLYKEQEPFGSSVLL